MKRVFGAAAVLVLGACRAIPLGDDPFTGRSGREPAVYDVEWWASLVRAPLWEYAPHEMASPAVDPDTGRVYVTTRDGFVRALSPVDGKVEWQLETGGPFSAGPSVREGVLYVPGGDGVLYALKSHNGELIWKYAAGEELASTPVYAAGKVLVASHSDALFAVNAETGKWEWQYRRDPPSGFTVRGAGGPRVDGNVAYVGFSDGYLVALDIADGTMKWERALGQGQKFLDVDATPVIDDSGRLYVASYHDGVFALSPETGETEWHTVRTGITHLLLGGEILYAVGDDQISALSARDGRVVWSMKLRGSAAHMPVAVRNLLAVPASSALLFVDPRNGTVRTSWNPGKGVSATPAHADGRIYVLSNLGYVYALRIRG